MPLPSPLPIIMLIFVARFPSPAMNGSNTLSDKGPQGKTQEDA